MSEHTTHYKPYNDINDTNDIATHDATQCGTMNDDYNETHDNSLSNNDFTIGIPIYSENNDRSQFTTTQIHRITSKPSNGKSKNTQSCIKKSPENTFYKNQKHISNNPVFAATYPPNNQQPFTMHNDDKMTLPEFVNKTLNYVLAQICVTAAVTTAMYVHKTYVKNYLTEHYSIVWLPIILTFGSLITMFCCKNKETEPLKKTMFCLFTVSCSAMVGISAIQYAPEVILNATVTTFVIVSFINIYAYNTAKNGKDFSAMGPTLMGFLMIVITLGIINIFVKSSMLQLCIAAVSVVIFTALLLFDLNRLYNGRELDDYEEPDPLLSAINIYLDIINLFLNLLQLFGGNSTD